MGKSRAVEGLASILQFPRPTKFSVPKKPASSNPHVPVVNIKPSTQLHDLAKSEKAYLPFYLLDIDHSFLKMHPDEWETQPDAQRLKSFVQNFQVTNDCSKRACQLVSNFKERLPKDPAQQRHLFATIYQQRRERPSLARKDLAC